MYTIKKIQFTLFFFTDFSQDSFTRLFVPEDYLYSFVRQNTCIFSWSKQFCSQVHQIHQKLKTLPNVCSVIAAFGHNLFHLFYYNKLCQSRVRQEQPPCKIHIACSDKIISVFIRKTINHYKTYGYDFKYICMVRSLTINKLGCMP